MSVNRNGFAVALIILLLSSGQAFSADKRILLNELYDNARLELQIDWVRASMKLDGDQYALPETVVSTVNQVVEVRYSRTFHRSSMLATLDEALSVGELLKLLDWYNSNLGQKVLHLEMAANSPSNRLRMQGYIEEKLGQQLPRTSRIRLIEELMETMDAAELGTELVASASVGAQRLLREIMPMQDGRPMRPPEILKAREKPDIRKGISDEMRNIYLYTYRSLPDNEIRAYLDFARSSAMQNFQRGQMQAMARML
ncbi:hypothetical protein GZ77_12605 [Endozoicomonas montiporae]|uniref:DUF2059 domain-containing protein n=2 Tax=Endozoicomonas montiporae TaxID=1027273 RepID=A0A081N499_9GAMM|nr:DUF2059 domain-containing protein [Endozoicomonas montiporae]AMO57885.1 hypothetical protein EZMO1_3945 [Endozoicomonas montiporae CL-33]KEQ13272.1 hypothetical protein GZ77_12605 [Endozoicomonas montiporae]